VEEKNENDYRFLASLVFRRSRKGTELPIYFTKIPILGRRARRRIGDDGGESISGDYSFSL
jgi:hypothetical protein